MNAVDEKFESRLSSTRCADVPSCPAAALEDRLLAVRGMSIDGYRAGQSAAAFGTRQYAYLSQADNAGVTSRHVQTGGSPVQSDALGQVTVLEPVRGSTLGMHKTKVESLFPGLTGQLVPNLEFWGSPEHAH